MISTMTLPCNIAMSTLVAFVLISLATAQAIDPVYSSFDLFKNTGFAPCPINTNVVADSSTSDFVVERIVHNYTEFCSFMVGFPIMIPTKPTQVAFFPWYPTMLLQATSLMLSYAGLWMTFRNLERQSSLDTKRMPVIFWAQLPFDIGRIIAFLFKTFHGFADQNRFAWTNALLWLLPFNYIFITALVRRDPYAGITMLSNPKFSNSPSQVLMSYSSKPKYGKTFYLCTSITCLLWTLTFISNILHFRFTFSNGAFTRTYTEITSALDNPTSLGVLPQTCVSFLQTTPLSDAGFFVQNTDHLAFALIASFQLLTSTGTAAFALVLGGRKLDDYPRAARVLRASAAITLAALLLSALGVGSDLAVKIAKGGDPVGLRFTNDLRRTGGCTFAFVNMSKKKGYWDVEFELAFRVAMSFLGGA